MRKVLIGVALCAVWGQPAVAQTQNATVSLCEEAEIVLTHPAEYLQEKVKRKGLSCLFLPHCCTPAWVLSPSCYVMQTVLKRNAWQELVNTMTCKNYSLTAKDAFEKWLGNLFSPGAAIGFTLLTGSLDQVFKAYLIAANAAASPLPNDVSTELRRLVAAGAVPFTQLDINNVKQLAADHALAKPLFPGGPADAITYHNLIIARPSVFLQKPTAAAPRCRWLAAWAHELTHVHQYNQFGFDAFITTYLDEGQKGYENISFEAEAYAVDAKVERDCRVGISHTRFTARQPIMTVVSASSLPSFSTELTRLVKTNEAVLNPDGSIQSIAPAAMSALARRYGASAIDDLIKGPTGLPDLVVGKIRYDDTRKVVEVVISNVGTVAAGPFDVLVSVKFWGAAGTRTPSGGTTVNRLNADASITVSVPAAQIQNLAALAGAGMRFDRLAAFVDSTFKVMESREDNNKRSVLVK
jgi:hypothetical protein